MLSLGLYIHSSGSIGPAADPALPAGQLLASEPDYTSFIAPMQLRRMSKVVRMGVGAAKAAMAAAGRERPDALSVGTAFGCLQDTEIFLSKMVGQAEKMLTPTAFIQSTHNTVGGQIALLAGCNGHNMTYVHGGHSFEHAIINTKLYLQDHPAATVLAGGIDELTDSSYRLMQRTGLYSDRPVAPAGSMQGQDGAVAGEGAAFFTVSSQAAGAIAQLRQLHLCQAPTPAEACLQLTPILQAITDADLIVLGRNGDKHNTAFYDQLQQTCFPGKPTATFKHLCGEYATAGAYGLSLICNSIAANTFPDLFLQQGRPEKLQRIVLLNHYCNYYSCWVLEAV